MDMHSSRPREAAIVATLVLLMGLAACSPTPGPSALQRPALRSTIAVVVPQAGVLQTRASNAPLQQATAEFMRLALNALLVPLLDEEVPARSADPTLSIDYRDGEVSVDGDLLDVGTPVGDAFKPRWRMESCTPLGNSVELSGEVELQVLRLGRLYTALVRPEALRVTSAEGTDVRDTPFEAGLDQALNQHADRVR